MTENLTPLDLIEGLKLETPDGLAEFKEYSPVPKFRGRNTKVKMFNGSGLRWFKLSELKMQQSN